MGELLMGIRGCVSGFSYYPKQLTDSVASLTKFQGQISQNQNK